MTEHSPSAPTPSDFIGPVPLLATDKTAEKEKSSEPFPLKTYLYNNNPFYVVSALLLLYAVQTFHGNPAIGAIDCWWMMAVLGGYALVLATIGVLIIRLGKVWEDARSILLILVLLFLAVSVSADDLFVHMETGQGGAALVIGGFLFCALVTEGVLRGAGIRLGLLYRVPFHLMLALFFVAPYWYSPGIHARATESIDWHLLGFPVVASVLILTLIPAVRAGKSYADKSGTPWTWPLYPWLAFWVFVWAFSLRSFALCLAYGQQGKLWTGMSRSVSSISFDTIWGAYFLIPIGLALLVVLLEMGLVTGNKRLLHKLLYAAGGLLILAVPSAHGLVYHKFLMRFTETFGSPLWLTTWCVFGFYTWAWVRKVPEALYGAAAALALLSVVGPETHDMRTFTDPQPMPFFVFAAWMLAHGIHLRSSARSLTGAIVLNVGLWLLLADTTAELYRVPICSHLLGGAIVLLGLIYRDPFARALRVIGALLLPLMAAANHFYPYGIEVALIWRTIHTAGLVALSLMIAVGWHSRWYFYAFMGTSTVVGFAWAQLGFRWLAELIGKETMMALVWSMGTLLLAFLISAHKANWIPKQIIPYRHNGDHRPTEAVES